MSKYKKSKIVNLFKIAYLPIIITIALVFFMSIISIHINSKNIINQYKEEGILLSNQIAFQLSKNIESQEEAERFLEGKIRTAAMTIHEIKEYELSNEWLEKMLDVFDVSELHYMDKDGEILFTTIEGYLGWKPHLEHPLYEFVNSTQKELMESIRPDDKYNIPTKYGALKADDGSFVQVGIDAQIVQDAKDQFSFQSVLDDVLKSPKVMSARYLDLDFNTVAYVQEKYISKSKTINLDDFNSSEDVLIEKVTSQLNQREIYTFYIPVFHNNQLEGILNIDYSLEQFYLYRR